nr:MAG TPA: hypothetical protein [Caudoviricetes sp.]
MIKVFITRILRVLFIQFFMNSYKSYSLKFSYFLFYYCINIIWWR